MTYKVFLGKPADPATRDCDWCDEHKATKAFELHRNRKKAGTAMYLYACNVHHRAAQHAAEGYKQPKTKEPVQEKIVGPGGSE